MNIYINIFEDLNNEMNTEANPVNNLHDAVEQVYELSQINGPDNYEYCYTVMVEDDETASIINLVEDGNLAAYEKELREDAACGNPGQLSQSQMGLT